MFVDQESKINIKMFTKLITFFVSSQMDGDKAFKIFELCIDIKH